MKSILAFSCVCAALLASGAATASPPFPGGIESDLQLSYSPQCAICHAGGVTGYGTVHMPFGTAMRERGLVPEDLSSLATALERMKADGVDSNGNGVPDVDELKAGADPNAGAPGAGDPPQYGCSAAAPAGPIARGAAALLFFIMILQGLRARRSCKRRGATQH